MFAGTVAFAVLAIAAAFYARRQRQDAVLAAAMSREAVRDALRMADRAGRHAGAAASYAQQSAERLAEAERTYGS
jgi:hypothetical protein